MELFKSNLDGILVLSNLSYFVFTIFPNSFIIKKFYLKYLNFLLAPNCFSWAHVFQNFIAETLFRIPLIHFWLMFLFYAPLKHQKTKGQKWKHWPETG